MKYVLAIILLSIVSTSLDAQSVYQLKNGIEAKVSAGDMDVSQDLNDLMAVYARQYSPKSAQYAEVLMWSARACAEAGDNKQAKRLMNQGLELFKQYGKGSFEGRDTINEIFYLDLKATLNYQAGRDFVAGRLQRQSCKLKRLYFGEQSEVYLKSLLDLSRLYAERLCYQKSEKYHNMGYISYIEMIKQEFCNSSESERKNYWNTAVHYINRTIDLAHQSTKRVRLSNRNELAGAAYNALLLSKGLLLNTSIGFENYINESQNSEAMINLTLKKNLSTQGASQSVLDSLDYVILKALRENGQAYTIPQLSITWQDVAKQLRKDDLAIEFYRTATNGYGAILLRHDWPTPRIVRLSNFISLNSTYTSLGRALSHNPFDSYSTSNGEKLWTISKAVWTDDIVKHFPKTPEGRIFFSADGELLVTGIEYLPFIQPEADGVLHTVSDLYHIYRLSSTRELTLNHDEQMGKDAVVYGGLLYNMTDQSLIADMKQYRELRQHDRYLAHRGAVVEDTILYLEGTMTEADSIVATINHASRLTAQPYLYDKGTEASFKSLNGKQRRIIHLATHGFYYNEGDSTTYNRFLPKADNLSASLTRSGLFMAGAESRYEGKAVPQGTEDGILTAYEVSMMDLRGLDLVALSACETAKGEVEPDGVFGLQRGFKMANANSILMSLWKVDDEATCLLMTEFYKNWIGDGKTKHDALEIAKQTVRSHKEKGWDDPKYWAAFILLDALD